MIKILSAFFLLAALNSQAATKRLLVLGDSLTEGYGVSQDASYPALLQKKIKELGRDWTVINAGISGSTSSSGLSRLKWHLKQKPDLMILALGANDGLRGVAIKETEKNLSSVIDEAQKNKIKVVLAGMMLPPNYGKDYGENFKKMYARIAKKHQVTLIPFLLEGVAGKPELNLPDGIHPNEKGYVVVAETVFKHIKPLL